MGILDDAIKEHLDLKRQHGADAAELQQLEDEAFGAAERPGDEASVPDPLAEAPTEFMSEPDLEQSPDSATAEEAAPDVAEPAAAETSSRRSSRAEIADLQEGPSETEDDEHPAEDAGDAAEDAEPLDEPAEEQAPAMEHEAVQAEEPPDELPSGPNTQEREAIAEQPTEMFDVPGELGPAEPEAPIEEELAEEEEEVDDFFDDKRLSDELDQALEAPVEGEPEYDPAPKSGDPGPKADEEDVLEETPDFLEEAPEDDKLWFEQKPPKDFDFDD